MMNEYKLHLETLFSKLATYRFTVARLDKLIDQDVEQLKKGGEFLNLSLIHIRDWSNLSDKNWYVDTRRLSFHSKEEYLIQIDEIMASISKHYLIETYERLADFLSVTLRINRKNVKIDKIVKKLDVALHNRMTPFNFNMITFLFCFCKARNAFTHNESVINPVKEFNQPYLIDFDIDQSACEKFVYNFFSAKITGGNMLHLGSSKLVFDNITQFVQSYAFELCKFYCEQDKIDWSFEAVGERLDIKTNLPLTDNQKEYLKKSLNNHK